MSRPRGWLVVGARFDNYEIIVRRVGHRMCRVKCTTCKVFECDVNIQAMSRILGPCESNHSKLVDWTGKRFGRLTVIREAESVRSSRGLIRRRWVVQCDCGMSAYAVMMDDLYKQISCGCERLFKLQTYSTTHGMSYIKEYTTWRGVISRIDQPELFPHYEGRSLAPSWRKFENFYKDMGSRPSP